MHEAVEERMVCSLKIPNNPAHVPEEEGVMLIRCLITCCLAFGCLTEIRGDGDDDESSPSGFDGAEDGGVDECHLNACGQCGPDLLEVCDGDDNDCDGTADEGLACYIVDDGEGGMEGVMIDNVIPEDISGSALTRSCRTCGTLTVEYEVDTASFASATCPGISGIVDVLAAVEEGITMWEDASGLAMSGRIALIPDAPDGIPAEVVVMCGDARTMCSSTNVIGCSDGRRAMVEQSFRFTRSMLVNVVAHEVGHSLSLPHSNGNCSVGPLGVRCPPCTDRGVMCSSIQDTVTLACSDEQTFFAECGECSECCGCGGVPYSTCIAEDAFETCADDGCGCHRCVEERCTEDATCDGDTCVADSPPTCSCSDGDSDRHYATSCTDLDCVPSDDCNNANAAIYPGAPEVCNSVDSDCDGNISEGSCALPNATATCAVGVCFVTSCTAGWSNCDSISSNGCETSGACVTCTSEICNGADDDCDGAVDEGIPTGAFCDGADGDLCLEGSMICSGGTMTCSDTMGTTSEVCNGADDDCDGSVDEGFGLGVVCDGADGDLCPEGTITCMGCSDTTGTTAEICGGGDEDCDGLVDEGLTCGCTGCTPGATETQSCDPTPGVTDYCTFTQSRTCSASCTWGSWGTCSGVTSGPQYAYESEEQCGAEICITVTEISGGTVRGYISKWDRTDFISASASWEVQRVDTGAVLDEEPAGCWDYRELRRIPFSFPASALGLSGVGSSREVRARFYYSCLTTAYYTSGNATIQRCD